MGHPHWWEVKGAPPAIVGVLDDIPGLIGRRDDVAHRIVDTMLITLTQLGID
jgi:hypothetical protein